MWLRGTRWKIGLGLLAAALGALLTAVRFTGAAPDRPEVLISLPGCPSSPNCVGSDASEDALHAVAPLSFRSDPTLALDRLKAVVALDGGRLVRADPRYLHFEYRSRFFRFVDDLECLLDADHGHIDIRSASRFGRSDLGVNRRRIERIRARFNSGASMQSLIKS